MDRRHSAHRREFGVAENKIKFFDKDTEKRTAPRSLPAQGPPEAWPQMKRRR